MSTEIVNQPDGAAPAGRRMLAPQTVRERLSRDVHIILKGCIREFSEDRLVDETCFDVDAVIVGRSTRPIVRYERRVAPVSWSRGKSTLNYGTSLTRSSKGSFIPEPRTLRAY